MKLSKSIKVKIINNLPANAVKQIAADINKTERWVQKVLYENQTDNYNIWEKAAALINKAKHDLKERERKITQLLED